MVTGEECSIMVFDGDELRYLLSHTSGLVPLHNEHGRCCKVMTGAEALGLDLDLFVGIGNRRRIRFLRLRTQRSLLNAGSRTTQRLRDNAGIQIAHPMIREHREHRGLAQ
jgi:hypothetical protein